MGPLVKTVMTRCIQCTRCVRFATEVAGVPELGAIGRGEDMEITTYLEKAFDQRAVRQRRRPLPGRRADLQALRLQRAALGAEQDRKHRRDGRAWAATSASIRAGREVMRVLPRLNDDVNEEWISDKTRHACRRPCAPAPRPALCARGRQAAARDLGGGLRRDRRADDERRAPDAHRRDRRRPRRRRGNQGAQGPDRPARRAATSIAARTARRSIRHGPRQTYLFNSDHRRHRSADALLIVGANPRWKRRCSMPASASAGWPAASRSAMIGERSISPIRYEHLGAGTGHAGRARRRQPAFAETLKTAKRPMIILGQRRAGAARRRGGRSALAAKAAVAARRRAGRLERLQHAAHRGGARRRRSTSASCPARAASTAASRWRQEGEIDLLFLLGADEIDVAPGRLRRLSSARHGDAGAHRADVILPGAAYTEKDGIYVNTEGRVQMAERAAFPPGDAREDWAILRALSDVLGASCPTTSLAQLREALFADASASRRSTDADHAGTTPRPRQAGGAWAARLDKAPFVSPITDFYLTNPIARARATMAECSATRRRHAAQTAAE